MTLDEERFSIFVSIVSAHPGITQEGLAQKSGFHSSNVEVICYRAIEAGLLVCFRGRYFTVQPQPQPHLQRQSPDPFFVTASKPAVLKPLPVPTVDGLDSWNVFYAQLQDRYDVSRSEFEALSENVQLMVKDAMQAYALFEWHRTPDAVHYTRTQENYSLIGDWLNSHRAPVTINNLSQAFKYLAADGVLKTKSQVDALQTETPQNTKGGILIN
jgi:hypothetical protein